jgi:hypothetical protein
MLQQICKADTSHRFWSRVDHQYCRPCFKKMYGTGRTIEGRNKKQKTFKKEKVVQITRKKK